MIDLDFIKKSNYKRDYFLKRRLSILKKRINVILAMGLCLGLTACGGNSGSTTTDTAETEATATEVAGEEGSTVSEGEGEAGGETIKIGVAGCITGSNAESGRQTVEGAKLAAEYINENGGIQAFGGRQVELVLIDNTSDANQSALALERALDANPDIVGIVGNPTSSALLPMLPVLQRYQVPALASTAANAGITEQGCEYIFQPTVIGSQQSELMVNFLKNLATRMGIDPAELKIGIVYENSSWGQDVANGNKELCEQNGLNVAIEETYPSSGLSDAGPIVTKLKNADVDVLLAASYVPDTRLLVSTMNTMSYKPIIIGSGGGLGWPTLVNDMGDDTTGICCINAWLWDASFVRENKAFYDEIRVRYEETHDNEFMGEQVGPAFICTMMIKDAIENSASLDPTVIRDEISKMTGENNEWFALIHPESEFNEAGRNIGSVGHLPIMGQWQDGRLRAVFPEEYAETDLIDPLTLEPFGSQS